MVSASLRKKSCILSSFNHMMFISFECGYLTILTNLFLSLFHLKSPCYAPVLLPIHTSWFDLIPQTSTPSLTPSISVIPIYHSFYHNPPTYHPSIRACSSMLPLDPSFHLLVQPGDDLERNDGSSEKPFLMSPELHRILGQSSQVRWYPVLLSTTSATSLVSLYQSVRDRTVLDRHHLAKSKRCQVPHSQQLWDYRRTMISITPDSFGSDLCWRPPYTVGVMLALEVFYLFMQSATSEWPWDIGG